MTVWRYFRGPDETDPIDFPTREAAEEWLAENDPEGVAWEVLA